MTRRVKTGDPRPTRLAEAPHWQPTKITDPHRAERFWLAIAVATPVHRGVE